MKNPPGYLAWVSSGLCGIGVIITENGGADDEDESGGSTRAPLGIANGVHSGDIRTKTPDHIMDRYVEPSDVGRRDTVEARAIAAHPIGRLSNPDELGGGVVYLSSSSASSVASSKFVVDSGFTSI